MNEVVYVSAVHF